MDHCLKNSTIDFQLDLNLDSLLAMLLILYTFPEEKLQSSLLWDKMNYRPENS